MTVAQEILHQLGGRIFIVTTGSEAILSSDNSITLKLARNKSKANELKITLNGLDLYDMEFIYHKYPKLNKKTWIFEKEVKKEVKTYKDIYFDQLQELFTEVTGIYTRLF